MKSAISLAAIFSISLSCNSAADKAKVRAAVSAFRRAADSHNVTEREDPLMVELQNAIDAVPDGKERTELLRCQHLLKQTRVVERTMYLDYDIRLSKSARSGQPTKKEIDDALAQVHRDHPLPDPENLSRCRAITIPDLAR